MRIREATIDDLPAIMTVLDAALLEHDVDALRDAIARGDALVAVEGDRVLGTLVLVDREIEAVAVRRNRRNQGIGTALVTAAADRRDRLVAAFDPRVRPFWEALGFDVEPIDGSDRYRGVLTGTPDRRSDARVDEADGERVD